MKVNSNTLLKGTQKALWIVGLGTLILSLIWSCVEVYQVFKSPRFDSYTPMYFMMNISRLLSSAASGTTALLMSSVLAQIMNLEGRFKTHSERLMRVCCLLYVLNGVLAFTVGFGGAFSHSLSLASWDVTSIFMSLTHLSSLFFALFIELIYAFALWNVFYKFSYLLEFEEEVV